MKENITNKDPKCETITMFKYLASNGYFNRNVKPIMIKRKKEAYPRDVRTYESYDI